MGNLLASAAAWLDAKRKKYASQTVSYGRGDQSNDEIAATIGQTTFEVIDANGLLRQLESRDYLISVADLKFGDTLIEPLAGDRITETIAGELYVYECMGFGGQPAWRYSDPFRNTYRIHTKLLRKQSA